jgi:DNA polymerase-4
MMLEKMLRQQPVDGAALFVDMNSFFASVEQQVHPELRNRPVGVCPFINDATCVIAASIEAKRYGVKTGTKIPEARRLCPEIVLLADDPKIYRDYHHLIMGELDNTRCRVVIKSIDEALLQVPSDMMTRVHEVAAEVKQRIGAVGDQLKCSIGIGSNLFISKVASNFQKPDGLTEVMLAELEGFYSVLELTDLYGISRRTARQLRLIGISTPLDFYRAPYGLLRRHWGLGGEAWYLRLRGYEVDLKPTTRRSIGHQTTIVPRPAATMDELLRVAGRLVYKTAARLRTANLAAKGVVVFVRFTDHSYWHSVYNGRHSFSDSVTFLEHVRRLLGQVRLHVPVRLVGVSVVNLTPLPQTNLSLFGETVRRENLSQALDKINYQFGADTIITASQALSSKVYDRIGFGNATQNANELPQA